MEDEQEEDEEYMIATDDEGMCIIVWFVLCSYAWISSVTYKNACLSGIKSELVWLQLDYSYGTVQSSCVYEILLTCFYYDCVMMLLCFCNDSFMLQISWCYCIIMLLLYFQWDHRKKRWQLREYVNPQYQNKWSSR